MSSEKTKRSGLALVAAALFGLAPLRAAAIEQPKDFEGGLAAEALMASMREVLAAFGPDAVVLQAALLNEAVRNGSILEAKVEAPRYQERDGKRYLLFVLESGIIFNDKASSADDRMRRGWADIVAPALRRLTAPKFEADGLAFDVGYHHRPFEDESQLRAELPDGRGQAEKMSYLLLLPDALSLSQGSATPDDVLGRAVVLRDSLPLPPAALQK